MTHKRDSPLARTRDLNPIETDRTRMTRVRLLEEMCLLSHDVFFSIIRRIAVTGGGDGVRKPHPASKSKRLATGKSSLSLGDTNDDDDDGGK